MKRFIPGIAILLILSLTACSAPKTPPKDTGDASNSQSEGIIRLDEGEWPVNEYGVVPCKCSRKIPKNLLN